MTDKERLEDIKRKEAYLEGTNDLVMVIETDDYRWLIQQVERVQELETTVDFYQSALRDADRRVQELENHIDYIYDNNVHLKGDYRLQEQNKRYREALELIVKQETLGKDVKTGKTAISYNGMTALKGLGIFNDDEYIVYGVDEIIENVLDGHE